MIQILHTLKLGILSGVILVSFMLSGVFAIDYTLDSSTRVYDRAGVIDDAVERQLDAQLLQLEQETVAQMIIVTLGSLEGRTAQEVALQFGRQNGIGDSERNTGLVLLVAIEDRAWRIEVGYGLEGLITDLQAARLGREVLVPYFRQEQYSQGIQATTNELIQVLRGDKELEAAVGNTHQETDIRQVFVFGMFGAIFLGSMIASGKPKKSTKTTIASVGSGLTAMIGGALTGRSGLLIIIPLYFIRKLALNAKPSTGGFRGGGIGGGYGGGSFSGGGFSGFGGGSFGGGGAGGSW